MAQPTVGITNPTGSTALSCLATGFAQPTSGNALAGMGYQINTGPINSFGNFPPGGGSWSFTLTANDCPTVGATYLLTVYAGDTSGHFGTASVSFRRQS